MPIEFPDGNTPVASHMYIFHGADWISAMPLPVATLARNIQDSNNSNSSPSLRGGRSIGEGRAELERVIAKVKERPEIWDYVTEAGTTVPDVLGSGATYLLHVYFVDQLRRNASVCRRDNTAT